MKTQSHLASSLPVRITSDHPGHVARILCIQESQGFSVDLLGLPALTQRVLVLSHFKLLNSFPPFGL